MQSSNQNLTELAAFYFRSNQYQFAKEILVKLISSKEANSKCFELLAYIFGKEGNYEEAKKLLTIACTYTEVTAEAHFYLGKILNELGDYDTAIKHLEQSIHIGGEFFEGFFELGLAFANLRKIVLQKIIFIKPFQFSPTILIHYLI